MKYIKRFEKFDIKKEDVVAICLSGRGDKDLDTYMNFLEADKN